MDDIDLMDEAALGDATFHDLVPSVLQNPPVLQKKTREQLLSKFRYVYNYIRYNTSNLEDWEQLNN